MEAPTGYILALSKVNSELDSARSAAPAVARRSRPTRRPRRGRTQALRVAVTKGLARVARLVSSPG
jgi:hypothetical protein